MLDDKEEPANSREKQEKIIFSHRVLRQLKGVQVATRKNEREYKIVNKTETEIRLQVVFGACFGFLMDRSQKGQLLGARPSRSMGVRKWLKKKDVAEEIFGIPKF